MNKSIDKNKNESHHSSRYKALKYRPDYYYKDIFSINYDQLKNSGIKYLLFDIDNTTVLTTSKLPQESIVSLINDLKKNFTIIILTNALPHRALKIGAYLDVDTYYLSFKPCRFNYHKIIKKYQASPNTICAIGDQLCTDILGANKQHITSILVDPLSNHESIFTKINRLKEYRLNKKYHLIRKGEYNE